MFSAIHCISRVGGSVNTVRTPTAKDGTKNESRWAVKAETMATVAGTAITTFTGNEKAGNCPK
jgi:hypothetical protein